MPCGPTAAEAVPPKMAAQRVSTGTRLPRDGPARMRMKHRDAPLAWRPAFGPLRPFAKVGLAPSMRLRQASKAWPPGSQSRRGLACSGSMDRAGRDHRACDSAHVLRAGLRPSLPLCFAASPTRRSRQAVDREGRENPLAHSIGSAGRVAQRSQGGDVGRRPASRDTSAAARLAGPIPHLSTIERGPRNRRSRTSAKGRKPSFSRQQSPSANIAARSAVASLS